MHTIAIIIVSLLAIIGALALLSIIAFLGLLVWMARGESDANGDPDQDCTNGRAGGQRCYRLPLSLSPPTVPTTIPDSKFFYDEDGEQHFTSGSVTPSPESDPRYAPSAPFLSRCGFNNN